MYAVSRDWNILWTYLKQRYGKMECLTVITNESYGVVHVLIAGLPFIPFRVISRWWNQIHGMGFVWITLFRGSAEEMSNYLMSQYLANQKCIFRFKMSNDWICRHFIRYWRIIRLCSKDYTKEPIIMYGRAIYPLDKKLLISNYYKWIERYVRTGLCYDYL